VTTLLQNLEKSGNLTSLFGQAAAQGNNRKKKRKSTVNEQLSA